ncbi:hypothetical protein [Bacillus mycoides]|nr:hypothetical protein [Bacillus mycoides]
MSKFKRFFAPEPLLLAALIFCNWLHLPDVFNVILRYDIKE